MNSTELNGQGPVDAGVHTSKKTFFLRGLLRLGKIVVVAALTILALNVAGFLAYKFNMPMPLNEHFVGGMGSYLGRASMLALSALISLSLLVLASLFLGGILIVLYYGVLFLGGYRFSGRENDI